jgi:hypothetical protein
MLRASSALLIVPALLAAACNTESASSSAVAPDPGATGAGGGSEVSNLCGDVSADLIVSDTSVSPAVAVTSTNVFWLDRGEFVYDSVQSAPLDGTGYGSSTTIYSADTDTLEDFVRDGETLYILDVISNGDGSYSTKIVAVLASGGEPRTLATDGTDDLEIGVADGYVYVTDGLALKRVATSGGELERVDGVEGGLTTYGTAVYWTAINGELRGLSSSSASLKSPEVLVGNQVLPNGYKGTYLPTLVANASDVYWPCQDNNGGLLCGASISQTKGPTVVVTPLALGGNQLAADGDNLYFVNQGSCQGSLERIGTSGGTPTTLASGFQVASELTTAHAIAVDDTYVYWTSLNTGVYRTAK